MEFQCLNPMKHQDGVLSRLWFVTVDRPQLDNTWLSASKSFEAVRLREQNCGRTDFTDEGLSLLIRCDNSCEMSAVPLEVHTNPREVIRIISDSACC